MKKSKNKATLEKWGKNNENAEKTNATKTNTCKVLYFHSDSASKPVLGLEVKKKKQTKIKYIMVDRLIELP